MDADNFTVNLVLNLYTPTSTCDPNYIIDSFSLVRITRRLRDYRTARVYMVRQSESGLSPLGDCLVSVVDYILEENWRAPMIPSDLTTTP